MFLFGLWYGFGSAFFWANRNLLKIKSTTTTNRMYYLSLESFFETICRILVPIIVGWFLVFGEKNNIYSVELAYKIVALLATVILVKAGLLIQKSTIVEGSAGKMLVRKKSPKWKVMRLLVIATGITSSLSGVIPVIMIMIFIGSEEVVGVTQSVAAILSALAVYQVGKKISLKGTFKQYLFGSVLCFLGAIIFSWLFSAIGIVIYILFKAFAGSFTWLPTDNITMNLIEKENGHKKLNPYIYLFDWEVTVNFGRSLGVLLFLLILNSFSQEFSLRYILLILALIQLISIWPMKWLITRVGEK